MTAIEIAYRALLGERCPGCQEFIDPSHADLSQDKDDIYSTVYDCPNCDTRNQFSIAIKPPVAFVSVKSADGSAIRDSQKMLTRLKEQGQDAKQQFDFSHYLDTSLNIVYQNLKNLFGWGEHFPEVFEHVSGETLVELDDQFKSDLILDLGRDKTWTAIHTDIHNYLSSVYSLHQFIEETIPPILESDAKIDRIRKQYNEESKPLLGLRHYTQHRMITPLHIRLNTGSAERVVDFLIELENIRQYDYRDGFDHWFSNVDGDYIDLIDLGIRHYQNVGNYAILQIQNTQKENAQSFEDIENLQNEYPTLDDIDEFIDTYGK